MISKGKQAEVFAEKYLINQGLTLIERNFRHRSGEIDLIMRDNLAVVFVEVRSRKSSDYGSALESVDFIKQKKLRKTADFYLQSHKLYGHVDSRFDIIAIDDDQLEWVKDAFEDEE